MKASNALKAFVAVLITIVVLSIIGAFGGPPVSESVLTGLIGLAGGFAMGRSEGR
jgi:small-conductance mechanosensitive channel